MALWFQTGSKTSERPLELHKNPGYECRGHIMFCKGKSLLRDQAPVDQVVGGSSPPSWTSLKFRHFSPILAARTCPRQTSIRLAF